MSNHSVERYILYSATSLAERCAVFLQ